VKKEGRERGIEKEQILHVTQLLFFFSFKFLHMHIILCQRHPLATLFLRLGTLARSAIDEILVDFFIASTLCLWDRGPRLLKG